MNGAEHIFFYNFLVDRKYSLWRHIVIILILFIISFNQVFIIYREHSEVLGYYLYVISIGTLLFYSLVVYLNFYWFVPRYLLRRKYKLYGVVLCLAVFFLLALLLTQEYAVHTYFNLHHRIKSYTNPLILLDSLSSCAIIMVCFAGTIVTVVLKKWILEKQNVIRLEQEHIASEVEQLKEQITPDFLSDILNTSSAWVKTDPHKASEMLMSVSGLLRYQLYDCSRNKVLLDSEIEFLKQYLELKKKLYPTFDFTLSLKGNSKNIWVSPLLFISFVQKVAEKESYNKSVCIDLNFRVSLNTVVFTCRLSDGAVLGYEDFTSVKRRLELVYPDKYSLLIKGIEIVFRLNIV